MWQSPAKAMSINTSVGPTSRRSMTMVVKGAVGLTMPRAFAVITVMTLPGRSTYIRTVVLYVDQGIAGFRCGSITGSPLDRRLHGVRTETGGEASRTSAGAPAECDGGHSPAATPHGEGEFRARLMDLFCPPVDTGHVSPYRHSIRYFDRLIVDTNKLNRGNAPHAHRTLHCGRSVGVFVGLMW